jgi:hypothetical protein
MGLQESRLRTRHWKGKVINTENTLSFQGRVKLESKRDDRLRRAKRVKTSNRTRAHPTLLRCKLSEATGPDWNGTPGGSDENQREICNTTASVGISGAEEETQQW